MPARKTTAKKAAPRTTAKAKVEETPEVTEAEPAFPAVEEKETSPPPRKRRGYFAV